MTIIKKFETVEQKKKFPKNYIALSLLVLFILVLVEIWTSNVAIAYGEKFEQLSQATKNLKMENQILENEIAKSASLLSVASKSAELGFSYTQSIQYIR